MSRPEDGNRRLGAPGEHPSRQANPACSNKSAVKGHWKPFFLYRALFGTIFLAASVDKILHPAAFARVIYNYQILPDPAINLVAVTLPWIEAFLGVLILGGLWLPGALSLANLLLLAFSSALAYNLLRGLDVHCGCFSTSAASSTSVWLYALRDLAFLGLGGFLFFQTFFRTVAFRCSEGAQDEWLEQRPGAPPAPE